MTSDARRALVALQQTASARQQQDAAALQRAETRLVSLRNALRAAQQHRDRVLGALATLGSDAPTGAQPLDRAWSWRARLQRGRDALAAAEGALASARAGVEEAMRLRDALRQSVTVATARRAASEARLEAPARTADRGDDD